MNYLASLICIISFAQAQSPLDWLNRIVSAEEHLIHREEMGPYLVSADGQRLLDEPYLRLDIRHEGKPVAADTALSVKGNLYQNGLIETKTYEAVYDGSRFVIELLLDEAKSWNWDETGWLELTITIDGAAGFAQGSAGFQIFPPKPTTGRFFSLINFIIPLLVVVIFAGIYAFSNVRVSHIKRESQ